MGYVSVRQHNKQAILGRGIFSYCVVRRGRREEPEKMNAKQSLLLLRRARGDQQLTCKPASAL